MRTLVALSLLVCAIPLGKTPAWASGSDSPVWYWRTNDQTQRMKLEVWLDSKPIFTTGFSLARTNRAKIPHGSSAKRIEFSFKPNRSIAWEGYRDETIRSQARQPIQCDIWMAGADEGAIILGVSFDKSDTILMSTLHLALPATTAQSEIAAGLVVVTSPVSETKVDKTRQRTGSPRWAGER